MSKKKPPKPTMNQVAETIDQMMANMNWIKNRLDIVGNIVDLYILFKGDNEAFQKHLEERKAKWEAEQKLKEMEDDKSGNEAIDEKDSVNSGGDQK
tara:strand:+ start:8 stop:295 length:288 start_codon:yes stop_codon:yes gene_type:complete